MDLLKLDEETTRVKPMIKCKFLWLSSLFKIALVKGIGPSFPPILKAGSRYTNVSIQRLILNPDIDKIKSDM